MAPVRGEQLPGFLDVVETWLAGREWFPARTGRRSLRRVGGQRLPTPEGEPDAGLVLEVHLLEVEHDGVRDLVSVPVALRTRPSALAGKDAFIGTLRTDDGERWLYDGARDQAFLAAWLEMARRRRGTRDGRAHGRAFADFAEHTPFTGRLRRSPMAGEREDVARTVVTADAGHGVDDEDAVVVDVLRRPEEGRSTALETALTLTQARSRSVAPVLGLVGGAWRTPDGRWAGGDLAVLRGRGCLGERAREAARTALREETPFVETARALGRGLGTFHADLAGALGAHPQTARQLSTMAQDARRTLAAQWREVSEHFDEEEQAEIGEVVDTLEMELREADEPQMLQHIHGDLDLTRLRGVEEAGGTRWIVSEEGGMVEHALPLRDVVTVLIALADAVMERVEEAPDASVNYARWYDDASRAVLAGYRSSDADAAGVDSVFFRAGMLSEAFDLFARWGGRWVFRPSMLIQTES